MMGPAFSAEASPAGASCLELSALYPENPFATEAYMRTEQGMGAEAWLLGCRDQGRLTCGCLGFLNRGRLNCALNIPSLPAVPKEFWIGLKQLLRQQSCTILDLGTFASAGSEIPSLGKEQSRGTRYEFVIPLEGSPEDLLSRMQMQHRQRVRKGVNAGLVFRSGEQCSLAAHEQLFFASMGRRESRGEDIESRVTAQAVQPFLESGFCGLYQAVLNDQVISSATVAYAQGGRYLHTSGTSPEGMKMGASHFLVHELMKDAKKAGCSVFNLGGTFDLDSGLAQYKKHFGARSVESQSAQFFVGGSLREAVSSAAGTLLRWKRSL